MRTSDVVIVGSGFTGLLAAQALRAEGMHVRLVDKAARPGGRLSTRRVGDSGIDSGIRSFEIRDRQVLEALVSFAGDCLQITDQPHGWHVTWDGTARQLAAALVAPMTVQTALVTHLRPTTSGLHLGIWGGEEQAVSRWVILTAPATQSHLLLQRSGLTMPGKPPQYERRLVLLAALTGEPAVAPGSPVFDQVEAWPHGDRWLLRARVTSQESARIWDHDATHTLAELLLELADVIGGVTVEAADCMRWRYAFATGVTPASHAQVDGLPVLLGGDGFGRTTVAKPRLSEPAGQVWIWPPSDCQRLTHEWLKIGLAAFPGLADGRSVPNEGWDDARAYRLGLSAKPSVHLAHLGRRQSVRSRGFTAGRLSCMH